MLRILVTKPGQPDQSDTFESQEVSIGRAVGNDLVLTEPGISAMHARIIVAGQELILLDLDSTNGTFVNGEKINGPATIGPSDEVLICALRLEFSLVSNHCDSKPLAPNSPSSPVAPPSVPVDWPKPGANILHDDSASPQLSIHNPLQGNSQVRTDNSLPDLLPPLLGSNPPPEPGPHPKPLLAHASGPEHFFPTNNNADRPPTMIPSGMPAPPPKLNGDDPPLVGQRELVQSGLTQPPPPLNLEQGPRIAEAIAPQTIPPGVNTSKPTPLPSDPTRQDFSSSSAAIADSPANPPDSTSLLLTEVFTVLAEKFPGTVTTAGHDPEFRRRIYQVAEQLLINHRSTNADLNIESASERMVEELCGFGPITPYLDDPNVQTILIRGPNSIEIKHNNRSERLPSNFSCALAQRLVMSRMFAEDLSRSVGIKQGLLSSGRTIVAIDQAFAKTGDLTGALCWIGPQQPKTRLSIEQLVEQKIMPPPLANLLRSGICGRLNLLICIHPDCDPTPQVLAALMEECGRLEQTIVVRPNRSVQVPPSVICMDAHGEIMRFIELVRLSKIINPTYLVLSEISNLAQVELANLLSSIKTGLVLCIRAASAEAAFHNITNAHLSRNDNQARSFSEAPIPIDLVLTIGLDSQLQESITQLCEVGISQSGQPGLLTLFEWNEMTGQCAYSEGYPQTLDKLRERGVSIQKNGS